VLVFGACGDVMVSYHVGPVITVIALGVGSNPVWGFDMLQRINNFRCGTRIHTMVNEFLFCMLLCVCFAVIFLR
jgi:hypothetical protein